MVDADRICTRHWSFGIALFLCTKKQINTMNKRKAGKILIFSSLFIWILDRTTGVISDRVGQLLYGDDYLRPVNGAVGDFSYGFNISQA